MDTVLNGLWLYGAFTLALFPIVDPLMAGFSFGAMTSGRDHNWKKRQALLACLYMVGILVSFQYLGTQILAFFSITIEAIQIAGGIMIWYMAVEMLHGKDRLSEREQTETLQKQDVAFTPIAMPLLSGPGAIAVTLTLAAQDTGTTGALALDLSIITIAFVTYLSLRFGPVIESRITPTGRLAFTKILGFLLLCISIQFIMSGIRPLLQQN